MRSQKTDLDRIIFCVKKEPVMSGTDKGKVRVWQKKVHTNVCALRSHGIFITTIDEDVDSCLGCRKWIVRAKEGEGKIGSAVNQVSRKK